MICRQWLCSKGPEGTRAAPQAGLSAGFHVFLVWSCRFSECILAYSLSICCSSHVHDAQMHKWITQFYFQLYLLRHSSRSTKVPDGNLKGNIQVNLSTIKGIYVDNHLFNCSSMGWLLQRNRLQCGPLGRWGMSMAFLKGLVSGIDRLGLWRRSLERSTTLFYTFNHCLFVIVSDQV